ncbi:MAG: AmmeMemoRadiSam system protein B [Aquificaceae bacterium]
MRIRKPAAAGSFYPSDPERLASYVDSLVGERLELEGEVEGLISPHAGYDYSGPIAGRVYSLLRGRSFKRVLLIGPSHFVDFDGLSLGSFDLFETPLGAVRVDREAVDAYARGRRWMLEDLPHLLGTLP